jgi:serine protease Do
MVVILASALAAFGADKPVMELIELKSGNVLKGEVLKEREGTLWIDVGVEVVKVPVRDVRSRIDASKGGTPAAASVGGAVYGESGNFYATKDLPQKSVKELVEEFGEAVVLVKTPGGLGSGFVIDADGHCITNAHVVEGETRISVDMFIKSGNSISERNISGVEIVALSPFFDLALLKIPTQKEFKFTRVFLPAEDDLRQGDLSFAIGNPLGLSRSVTQGIISNKNRNMRGQVFYQTTAQINPGNSGGPLFNGKGQVIGVNSLKIGGGEGLGFAIPVHYVKDFLRSREAFAYNKDNPNTGYRYHDPPRRVNPNAPPTK